MEQRYRLHADNRLASSKHLSLASICNLPCIYCQHDVGGHKVSKMWLLEFSCFLVGRDFRFCPVSALSGIIVELRGHKCSHLLDYHNCPVVFQLGQEIRVLCLVIMTPNLRTAKDQWPVLQQRSN